MGPKTRILLKSLLVTSIFALQILQSVAAYGDDFIITNQPTLVYSDQFGLNDRPDLPLRKFAQGQLGILSPGYARSYLFVAYRYLTGHPLAKTEQDAAVSLWDARLNLSVAALEAEEDNLKASWVKQRSRVVGKPDPPELNSSRLVNSQEPYGAHFCNCGKNAFDHAASILQSKIERFGADSPAVREWTDAQDTVFRNCSNDSGKQADSEKPSGLYPGKLPAGADSGAQMDRDYQIAAAHFYALDLKEAVKEFEQIAATPQSPYKELARYLTARAMIREATLADQGSIDLESLTQEKPRLELLLADASMATYKNDVQALLNFVNGKIEGPKRLQDLTIKLLEPATDGNFRQDLLDFILVYDQVVGSTEYNIQPVSFEKIPKDLQSLDLTDWLSNVQLEDEQAQAYAIGRWQKNKELPWLVAALARLKSTDSAAGSLIAEAQNIAPQSPAYLTVSDHLVRLMLEGGKKEEARARLDLLLSRTDLPPSVRNEFLSRRITLAKSLDQFMADAVRTPIAMSDTYYDCLYWPEDFVKAERSPDYALRDPAFPNNVCQVLNNGFPLDVLAKIAGDKNLSAGIRHELDTSIFLRAIYLSDEGVAKQMADSLKISTPAMAPYLDAWISAKSEAEKRFAVALFLLKFPEIDPNIGNATFGEHWWWSAFTSSEPEDLNADFFSPEEKQRAAAEVAKLDTMPGSDKFLCPIVIAYAQSNPMDRRVPEALHLAVHATRFSEVGHKDDEVSKLSRECFVLLHKNYPDNPWTAKTKYWY